MLLQVGAQPTEEQYSTWLLRRATASPARVASHLTMLRAYQLAQLARLVPKMAVVLPKYDAKGPSTWLGSAQQQLDAIVADITEKVIKGEGLSMVELHAGHRSEWKVFLEQYYVEVLGCQCRTAAAVAESAKSCCQLLSCERFQVSA
jgi:hypothetical protein